MNYRVLVLLVCLSLSFIGCHNDDDTSGNSQEPSIVGAWDLSNVSGGLAGLNDDYEAGIITWTFNTETSQVTVTNLNVELVIFDGLATGTYDYVLDTNSTPQTLNVENLLLNINVMTDAQLILDEGVVDGFSLGFER